MDNQTPGNLSSSLIITVEHLSLSSTKKRNLPNRSQKNKRVSAFFFFFFFSPRNPGKKKTKKERKKRDLGIWGIKTSESQKKGPTFMSFRLGLEQLKPQTFRPIFTSLFLLLFENQERSNQNGNKFIILYQYVDMCVGGCLLKLKRYFFSHLSSFPFFSYTEFLS